MGKARIVLTFPADLAEKPVVYRLVKDFDLVMNILRAAITPKEEGRMVLELEGDNGKLQEGLKFLQDQGIGVESLTKEIKIDEEECVDCGACLAVCHAKALSLNKETWKLEFNRDNCTLCELCVSACPLQVITTYFSQV